MKKILLSLLIGSSFTTFAQETSITDALRYGIENINGTARFRAMGGAFGAVGGDLSSMNVNPAGTSMFNHNQATVSLSSFNKMNTASYFGTSYSTNENTLDINQLGAVFVFNDNNSTKNGWKKLAIGLNYENANNLDDYIISEGVNPYNSMDAYFLRFANSRNGSVAGLDYGSVDFVDQQALLGYNSYLIEYNATGDNYYSNVPTGGNYYHKNTIEAKGYNGKFTANFSGAYEDKLYIGMNFNFHFTDYVRTSSLYESNNNPVSNTPDNYAITAARFDNELYTYGNGFSMNLGAIAKVSQNVRIGIAYQTPTWYKLNDELTQGVATASTNGTDNFNDSYYPNITNIYPTYKLQSPSKLTSSATVIFGKNGLISVDYTVKNYANTQFKPKNDSYFIGLNNHMQLALKDNYELRLGGEYKIKQWSLRGGYRFEASPYAKDLAFGDLTAYSSGLGYNFGNSKLDVSYSYEHRNRTEALLTSGLTDPARIKNYNNNVTLTYVINF